MIEEGEIIDFEHFFLPTLTHFENGNGWKGSLQRMRFEIEPAVEGSLHTVVWYGPFCRELSEQICETEFPLSEEGLRQADVWLHEKADRMNSAPERTYEQCLAWRNEAKKRKESDT